MKKIKPVKLSAKSRTPATASAPAPKSTGIPRAKTPLPAARSRSDGIVIVAAPPAATVITAQIDVGYGNTLFIRGDEAETSWGLYTPVLDFWRAQGRQGLESYPAGSWGPAGGDALLARSNHLWRQP